ncbi:MAG: hypothetical protein KA715_00250 [Xanthomonadaceae bacterium]|nr:hypothetical protein [Xanthomonadaceae bacterium]
MSLRTTSVSKCLDKKLNLFGFEIPDLLAIFLTLSILNFIFGSTSYKIFSVWLPSILLAVVLRVGKKGKPDNFLIHWIRYQLTPGILYSFHSPNDISPLGRSKIHQRKETLK